MKTTQQTKNLIHDLCDELTDELKAINLELAEAIRDEKYEKAAINRDLIEITIQSCAEVICTFVDDLVIEDVKQSFYKVNNTIFEVANELVNDK